MTVLAGFTSPTDQDPVVCGKLTRSMAQSLIQCAVLAYKSRSEVEAALQPDQGALLRFEWFEAVGRSFDSQGFACIVPDHVILACRGTKELPDFLTDVLISKRPLRDFNGNSTNGFGSVHLGFQRALNALWSNKRSARRDSLSTNGPPIDEFLVKVAKEHPNSQLWLTGHSLGAALATIAAARVQLTADAPFNGRVGGLVTVGSPRVLDHRGAERLMEALGSDKILRMYRSIDPVPAVPYWGFKHVSGGQPAFVSNKGKLALGVGRWHKWVERVAAFLRAVEDSVGSALPGQHRGFSRFVTDHASEDYLDAIRTYSNSNIVRFRDSLGPILVPLLKLSGVAAGGWAVADTTGVTGLAFQAVGATAQLLGTGAETMLAFLP